MIHLNDLTWTQVILIEAGVMLQLGAFFALMRETNNHRGHLHSEAEAGHAAEEGMESHPVDKDAETNTVPMPEEDLHPEIKAGQMMRTSKVAFKQSFKFREQAS